MLGVWAFFLGSNHIRPKFYPMFGFLIQISIYQWNWSKLHYWHIISADLHFSNFAGVSDLLDIGLVFGVTWFLSTKPSRMAPKALFRISILIYIRVLPGCTRHWTGYAPCWGEQVSLGKPPPISIRPISIFFQKRLWW